MQKHYTIPWWKTAPFTRLLFPFIAGIWLKFNYQFSFDAIVVYTSCTGISFALLFYLPIALRFRFLKIRGLLLQCLMIGTAALLTWQKDVRHHPDWYGNNVNDSSSLLIQIDEPPVRREKSVKAMAHVQRIISNSENMKVSGKLLLYFSKEDSLAIPQYGDEILIRKSLQPISSSGNPGAFDYKRYAAFQQIFHSVYLQPKDYLIVSGGHKQFPDKTLFATRNFIIGALRKYLPANDNITGIAEALLIGYKEDLDKELVQTYSNTGVVHIIAISGLHLGLLYVTLNWLLGLVPFVNKKRLLKSLLTLGFLWFFALLTGASASVLRSAVMFTCIVIGQNYFKQASVYNSLASSAVLLLCFDPFFLWDVGFQLSYLAIYGIVWLQRPMFRAIYIRNKWPLKLWEMASVTIAAQIIATPVCLFYFHQFPNYFLLTNLIAVPLSTIILFAEIIVLLFSWWAAAAFLLGKITGWMIWLMNASIRFCDQLPGSLTDNIYTTPATTAFLYLLVLSFCGWLLYRQKRMLYFFIFNAVFLSSLYAFLFRIRETKCRFIVYNVPKRSAADFIYKGSHFFYGDNILEADRQLYNFTLRPARIALWATARADSIPILWREENLFQFGSKKVLFADSNFNIAPRAKPIVVDVLVISGNARMRIEEITRSISPAIIIFDGSNSLWKIEQWKSACEQLLLPCFSVQEQGAYITEVDL